MVKASMLRGQASCCRVFYGDSRVDGTGLIECYRLRHDYFVSRRGWVASDPSSPGLEIDGYDAHCVHLAVFEEERPITYLRVLPHEPGMGFMLDREFSPLVPGGPATLQREGSVELSRLVCVAGGRAGGSHAVELLLRNLYALSVERRFSRFYVVVEESWLRPFERRFGLPFHPLGPAMIFPDGTETVAAVAELSDLEAAVGRRDPGKYEWYRSALERRGNP